MKRIGKLKKINTFKETDKRKTISFKFDKKEDDDIISSDSSCASV